MPVTRALVMDSPDDTDTWHVGDQFMIGSDLMFAPGGMKQSTATSGSVYMFRAILLLSANQFGIVFLCHFVIECIISWNSYFPKTASSWHCWFENTTYELPAGSRALCPYAHLAGPALRQGRGCVAVPAPGRRAHARCAAATHIFFSHSLRHINSLKSLVRTELVAFAPVSCGDGGTRWSSVYDDDGETTAYKTEAAAHWRGRAGYSCNSSHHTLRFEVAAPLNKASY